MRELPASAVSSWAEFAPVDTGLGLFTTLALLFVQLVGVIAIGNGVLKINAYVTPGHAKAPPSLGMPLMQIVFGLFALVPQRVYDLTVDLVRSMGWL